MFFHPPAVLSASLSAAGSLSPETGLPHAGFSLQTLPLRERVLRHLIHYEQIVTHILLFVNKLQPGFTVMSTFLTIISLLSAFFAQKLGISSADFRLTPPQHALTPSFLPQKKKKRSFYQKLRSKTVARPTGASNRFSPVTIFTRSVTFSPYSSVNAPKRTLPPISFR